MAISAAQKRRLEEQAKQLRQAQQSNKPPAVGSKRADGKIYSGQNYAYQSAGSHKQLKQDGKLKAGAQALDRLGNAYNNSSVGRAIKSGLDSARKATDKIPGIQQVDRLGRAVEKAADKTPQGIAARGSGIVNQNLSNATNLDPRITAAATSAAVAGIKGAAARSRNTSAVPRPTANAKATTVRPQPTATPRQSVGAAAAPVAAKPQPAPTRRELPRVNRPGTIQATRAKPSAPVQPAVAQPKAPTRQVRLGENFQRGEKNFTPARRAQAVQRANARPPQVEGTNDLQTRVRQSKPIGMRSDNTSQWKPNGRGHEISFDRSKNVNEWGYSDFASRKEAGIKPQSRQRTRLNSAGTKDLVGQTLKDVKPGDTVRATAANPNNTATNKRGALYGRVTKGAFKPDNNGDIHTIRTGQSTWRNINDLKSADWDPDSLSKPLNRLTQSATTRAGRRAGGTSNVKARISPAKNTVTPSSRVTPRPARSVGAAAPTKNPARPQPGRRLGGPDKRIAFQNTYHGTSARDAASIRANGYRPSATGVYGNNQVYTGNKKMAQQYAQSAGVRAGDQGAVLRHRVSKKNQANVPFEKPEARQRVSPQAALVQERLKAGKTTRIDYGNGSQVTPLTKAQADKTLVKPNGNIRLSKAQAAKVRANRSKPSAVTTSKTQKTKGRKVNLGNIQRGAKKFTPGTRAQAVKRANSRALNTPGYQARRNNAIGIDARRTIRPNGDNTRTHDIAFSNSDQKLNARGRNDSYGSRRDIGEKPKSKATERLRRSGLKDMMGRMLDINQFDTVTASPTTQSRGILYNRASKGALSTRRGDRNARSTRVGPNMWINHEDGNKRVKFDPKSLTEALTKQTKTQATRVGRAAGGTSKKPALIERPKNTIRNPKAQATKAKPGTAARKRAKVRQISEARSWVAQQERRRARREANPPNGNTIRERQGVVRSNRRSRVSAAQRAFERSASLEANWNALFTRVRTAAEEAAARRFINQRVGGREVDRGGRRTWNGTHETRRLRTRGRQ
jgi:hypothetical protein